MVNDDLGHTRPKALHRFCVDRELALLGPVQRVTYLTPD